MKEQILKEKLRENNRFRFWSIAICITGIVAAIGGLLTYLPRDTSQPARSFGAYYIPPEYSHPYETVSIILWIIGGVLLAIGIAGVYYFTKKHGELLDSMDD